MSTEINPPNAGPLLFDLSIEELFALSAVVCLLLLVLFVTFTDDDEYDKCKEGTGPTAHQWWEELRHSAHSRLVLPPDAFLRRLTQPNSKFSAKNLKNKGRMIYNKARRMIYTNTNNLSNSICDEILPEKVPPELTPLLCFVNTKSGGKHGIFAMNELKSLLNPIQVIDLQKCDPMGPLLMFSKIPSFRVLVCGGDGSVRWVLNCIEELPPERRPPVAILPLGTGNDLARILGWGAGIGIGSDSIPETLLQVQRAGVAVLDRWKLSFHGAKSKKDSQKDVVFNNYFGIGVDAQIVLNFHTMREQSPGKFFSRLVNQLWYGIVGWNEIWTPHCTNLKHFIKLTADGKVVELPEDTEGLIFSNIPSFGGGMKLWDVTSDVSASGRLASLLHAPSLSALDRASLVPHDAASARDSPIGNVLRQRKVQSSPNICEMTAFGPTSPLGEEETSSAQWEYPSIQDKKIEVVAVTGSLHLAQLKLGLTSCTKIAQCGNLEIETYRQLPFQVDGEPWVQVPGTVKLSPSDRGQVAVLKRHSSPHGADQDVSDVLNWAERGKVISNAQKNIILREFSRRREIGSTPAS